MTWTAAGSFGDQQAATFSLTPVTVGNLIILDVANFSNSTVFASSVASSNVTWTAVGHFLGSVNTGTHTLFLGTVTSTSTATVTPTWSGTTPAGVIFDWHEFHSSLGAWSVDTFTHLDNAGTTVWPSLTPATSGELYWGYAFNASTAASGTTSGYVYNVGSNTSNGQAYNLNCAAGTPTGPTWGAGDGGEQLGMMLLVQENAPATFPPVSAPRAYPPGWFPGADTVSGAPGAVPFDTPWQPAVAIIPPPPPPPPPAAQMRPVPPGWFPGCDGVCAAPGGVPFDTPFQPAASPPKPYIVGLGPGTGVNRWFVDQYGAPRVWLAGEDWGLPANAGGAGTGTWQQDYQSYLSTRAGQGYTVATVDPFGAPIHHGSAVGNTWDGIAPFTSNFNVFNETFWTRIDYLISLAATYGITINLDIAYSYQFGNLTGNTGTSTLFQAMTLSQATAYGVALGNRYKNTPNLLWMFGDDDSSPSNLDPLFANIAAGIRSTGDTHEMSIEYYASGTTCLVDLSSLGGGAPGTFGPAYATYDWVYYYWVSYWGVEEAYLADNALPVLWADGFFYDDSSVEPPVDRHNQQIQRNMVWWALSSGARGVTGGSEQVFPWWSAAASGVSTSSLDSLRNEIWASQQAFVVRQLLESLPNWYKLHPDTSSALVTAGRGTRASYNSGHFLAANSPNGYVTASYVADGSLALIYCDAAFSITIDQTKMASGYTATWVDPSNGTQTPTTTGSTYSSSGLGNNSAGNADWLLVLQGTPVPSTPGTAALSGLGTLSAAETLGTTAALSGLGSLSAGPVLTGSASLSGAGTLSSSPVLAASASLSGLGTLTASPANSGGGTAALSGLGTLTASPVLVGSAALSGIGTLSAATTTGTTAVLSGLGALTASPVLTGAASLSGSGTLTASPVLAGTVSLSGSGTLSAVPQAPAGANLSGLGTLTAADALTGAASLSGAGTLTLAPVLAGSAALSGLGTLTASPQVTGGGGASLSGTGTLTGLWRLSDTQALTGLGTLTAAETLGYAVTLSGLGTFTGTGVIPPPFTVGVLSASVSRLGTLSPTTAPLGRLTATTEP